MIRLEDERPFKTPSFEEIKPQLQQNLQRQAIDKVIGDLRAKAKVELTRTHSALRQVGVSPPSGGRYGTS